MGSFTDNPSLITYSPYVEQLPISAMVDVGRFKQAQYDQGIQKIQAQIDNVAGLDVVRDVDKQYLQSKLNQLGGNLRKVAAGDFSNYQLVNSVGGMVTKIAKDPTIQTAVSSTMKYKKGLAEMETARKEGKSSPSNEWDFITQANRWLNSSNPKEGFSGGYTPYTNYKKNALDAIKALTKDETITDDAFTIDSKGNLVIADATVRRKMAGISPDKIQQALMATLSPADFKQMEVDGRYNYSNVDGKKFISDINNSFNEKVNFYTNQKKVLENAKSSTTSNLEKTKLNDQIASLNRVIDNISAEHEGMMDVIRSGNIEAVKAQLHTTNFIDNFAKAFSFTETSQTYETSPLAQMAMQRATKEQDWQKFLIGLQWDKEKFALSFAQKEKELKDKEKETSDFGGLPQGIPQDQLPKYTLEKVVFDTEQLSTQVATADALFLKQQGKDAEWLEAQKQAWQKSPTAVDPKVANHFNSSEEMRRRAEANKAMIGEITKEAVGKFGDISQFIPDDPAVVVTTPQGVTVAYTPEDFVNFNENMRKYVKSAGSAGTGAPGIVTYDMERAAQELSPKELYLFQIQTNKVPSSPETKDLQKKIQHYYKTVNLPYKQVISDTNKFTADEVTKRVTVSQGVSYGIPTGNEYQKSAINTVLSQFIDLAESQKDALANSPNFDAEAARRIATANDITYSMTVVEGTQYQAPMYKINVSGKVGDKTEATDFVLTPEQKTAVFGNMFEASPAVQAFRPYQEQIRKMGGYSTASYTGPSNHENAFLSKVDFPSVETYGVKANIEQVSPGKYSIRLSVFDPVRKQWFEDISYPRTQLAREDQVIPLMVGLNDAAIFELVNEKAPTAEELKMVKEASKKPL